MKQKSNLMIHNVGEHHPPTLPLEEKEHSSLSLTGTLILPNRDLMPIIRAVLDRGQRVRMTVTGTSMLPFLYNKDIVELEPVHTPRLGDMVLVQTEPPGAEERYVLHRIVQMEDNSKFSIRGDAQSQCEGPFTLDRVLGRVTSAWHHRHARSHTYGLWRLAGLVWMKSFPANLWLLWLVVRIRRIGKRAVLGLQRTSACRE